jgi:glutamyl/glutaminyl-tRNA synthetase
VGGPVFDLAKLRSFNQDFIKALAPSELLARLRGWRLSDEHLLRLIPLAHQRIQTLDQFVPLLLPFFSGDLEYKDRLADLIPKGRTAKDTQTLLNEISDALDAIRGPYVRAAIEPVLGGFVEKSGWKKGELFKTMRVVVSGATVSPGGVDEMMEAMGKELVRRRIRLAVEALKAA